MSSAPTSTGAMPGRLRRVDREQRAVRVGEVGELLQHEPVAGRVLHVRDDDHRRLVVDVLGDLLERERRGVVPDAHEPRLRAGLARDAQPGVRRARVLDVDRDDVRALGRLHPPGDAARTPRSRSSRSRRRRGSPSAGAPRRRAHPRGTPVSAASSKPVVPRSQMSRSKAAAASWTGSGIRPIEPLFR